MIVRMAATRVRLRQERFEQANRWPAAGTELIGQDAAEADGGDGEEGVVDHGQDGGGHRVLEVTEPQPDVNPDDDEGDGAAAMIASRAELSAATWRDRRC